MKNHRHITVKALSKEQLLTIGDLNGDKILEISDLQSYTESLLSSVALFPVQKDKIELALEEKDYDQVFRWLKSIKTRLTQIHADGFAKDCEKQINLNATNDFESIRHDRLQMFINYFLSALGIMFADITRLMEHSEKMVPKQQQSQGTGMFILKRKLMSVGDLDSEKIEMMTSEQLKIYIKNLLDFAENSKTQMKGLGSSVKTKQYEPLIKWLMMTEESLTKIHANELLEVCREHINTNKHLNNIRHDKLEVSINYFVSSLSMLAEDIKALHLDKK